MLPNSSIAADSDRHLNVFQRAMSRLGIGNETGLRAQKAKLKATEATAPALSAPLRPVATVSANPPGARSRLSPTDTPEAMLEKFHRLKGAEKTAFFRAHKAELMAAEAAAPALPATRRAAAPVSASPVTARPEPSPTDTPEALLEKFQGMTGAGKTAFFRVNQSLLKAADAVVSARESTGEAPAIRNFSAVQAAAPPRQSGAELLETFHTLSGATKTAFFRANHLALKIAAANESR